MERERWQEDPLRARIELKLKLGAILCDQARYHSPEFAQTIYDIQDVNRLMRERGLYTPDNIRLLDSIRYQPPAE